jgi:hypothetical protein
MSTPSELASWLSVVRLITRLPWAPRCPTHARSRPEHGGVRGLGEAGGGANAILLPAGLRKLESAAPSHVAHVRHLVVDNLSSERLRRLGQNADRIVGRVDSPAR